MSVQYIAKSGKCQKGRYILKTSFCKTRKAIYNTDVVNWHNSFLFGTTGSRAGSHIQCETLSIAYTATDGGCSTQ